MTVRTADKHELHYGGMLFRAVDIQKVNRERDEKRDRDVRTAEFVLSTEAPVERRDWWGDKWVETLGHKRGEVDLSFIDSGRAPFLFEHTRGEVIGILESVKINDRELHGIARAGNSQRAQEVWDDIEDGIRPNISVGYVVSEFTLEKESDGVQFLRATQWQPLEGSTVSIPADQNAVVKGHNGLRAWQSTEGPTIIAKVRSAEPPAEAVKETETPKIEVKQMSKTTEVVEPEGQTTQQILESSQADMERNTQNVLKSERARVAEIEAIAARHKLRETQPELVEQARNEGWSPSDFAMRALEKMTPEQLAIDPIPRTSPDMGLPKEDAEIFSFARFIKAKAFPTDPEIQKAAGFELEVVREYTKLLDKPPQGEVIPPDVLGIRTLDDLNDAVREAVKFKMQHADLQTRDLTVGVAADGGNLVGTNLLGQSFIEILRNRSVFINSGATMLTGLVGNVAVPRQATAASATWLTGEGVAATESDATFDQVSLSPKDVALFTDYSRRLLQQSSIDIEAFVRNDIVVALALALDLAIGYGTGSNGQPTGIVNQTGIGAPTAWAGADPTWAEVVDLETNVSTANALAGNLVKFMDSAMRGALKTTEKASGTAQFIWGVDGMVNGYRPMVSQQITDGDIIFGNTSDILLGFWGGLDLLVDPFTSSTTGAVRVVGIQTMDVGLRHPESFALGNDTP